MSSAFRNTAVCLLAGILAADPVAYASAISWNGGTGNWTDSNWGCGVGCYPSNNTPVGTSYEVTIDTGLDNVTLNTTAIINSLQVADSVNTNSTLTTTTGNNLQIGDPSFGTAGVLTNYGAINLNSQLLLDTASWPMQFPPASTNSGTMTINGNGSFVIRNGGVGNAITTTLDGGGTIQLNGGTINGWTGGETLFTDNQIQGSGTVENINLVLEQTGLIDAQTGGLSVLSQGTFGTSGIYNDGTIQATSGLLTLDASAPGAYFVNNSDGTIQTNGANILLLGASNQVALYNQGTVNVSSGNTLTLRSDGISGDPGVYLTNDGNFNITNATLLLDANGATPGVFTLSTDSSLAAGLMTLTNGTIDGASGNEILFNSGFHTISGNGSITSNVTVYNQAYIEADGGKLAIGSLGDYFSGTLFNSGTFFVNSGADVLQIGNIASGNGIVTNNASIVINGGGLVENAANADALSSFLQVNNGNLSYQNGSNVVLSASSFTNNGSLTSASGSTVEISSPTVTNLSSGILTGGTWTADSGTLRIDALGLGGAITGIMDATVAVNGTGLITGDGSSNALSTLNSLQANNNNASLTFNALSSPLSITPAGGALTVSSTNDNLASFNVLAGTNLTINGGFTQLTGGGFGFSTTTVDASTLLVKGNFSQAINSNLNVQDGSTMTIQGKLANTQGTVQVTGGSSLTAQGWSNSGTFVVDSTSSADFRTGGLDTFGSLDSNGNLGPGIYNLSNPVHYDASAGPNGGAIITLNQTSISLTGAGELLYGGAPGSNTGTNALLQLTTLNASTLNLYNESLNITPQGGTLALQNESSMRVDGTGSVLTVNGNLTADSDFNVASSSHGATFNVTGTYTQGSTDALYLTGPSSFNSHGASIGGDVFVGEFSSDNSSVADFRSGTAGGFTSLSGGVLTAGSYALYGKMYIDPANDAQGGNIQTIGTNAVLDLIGPGPHVLYGGANGSPSGTDALTQVAANAGELVLEQGATLTTPGAFNNQGGTLLVFSGSSMTVDGAFDNGSATHGFAEVDGAGSTLTIHGALNNGQLNSAVDFANGAVATSFGFTNNGYLTIDATSTYDARAGVNNSFTNLSGGTLSGGNYSIGGLFYFDPASAGGDIINIASQTSLTIYGAGSHLLYGPGAGTDAMTKVASNAGSLDLEAGATLTTPGNFNNQGGTMTVNQTSAMTVNGTFDNGSTTPGYVFVTDNSTLRVNGSFNNGQPGSLLVVGNDFENASTFTSQSLTNNGSIFVGYGSSANAGTLNNLSGGTLTGGVYQIDGTFQYNGGNITKIDTGTTVALDQVFGPNPAQILNGINGDGLAQLQEIAGTFSLSGTQAESISPASGTLTVDNGGLLLLGNSAFSNTGQFGSGTLSVTGNVLNNGQITVGNSFWGTSGGLSASGAIDNEANLTVQQGSVTSNGFTNGANGTLTVEPLGTADFRGGAFTNYSAGSLSGGTYNIAGTVNFDGGAITDLAASTTLNLSGTGTMLYGSGSGTNALATLASVEGTLNLQNGAVFNTTPAGGTFTNSGTVTTADGSTQFNVTGNLTNTSTGSLQLNGTSNLAAVSGTLNNMGSITIGGSGNTLQADLMNSGLITLNDGATGLLTDTGSFSNTKTGTVTVGSTGVVNIAGTLTNDGSITLNPQNIFGTGGQMNVTGAATNDATGAITVWNTAQFLAKGFSNNGTLTVNTGGLADVRGGNFSSLSGGTLTAGTYFIGGTFQFDSSSGIIRGIGSNASVTLDANNGGAYSVLSGTSNALATLNSNAGTFVVQNGVTFSTTPAGGTFTNSGTLYLGGTSANSNTVNSIAVAGAFTNSGTGMIALNSGSGAVGDQLTATGAFLNQGTIDFNAAGQLVKTNTTFTNSGNITLAANLDTLQSVSDFTNQASGVITTADNHNAMLTSGGAFDNEGMTTVGADGQVSVTTTLTNGGTLTVHGNLGTQGGAVNVTGAVNNNGTIVLQASSSGTGASLTSGGTFTNTDSLDIGNMASVTVQNNKKYVQASGSTTVEGGGTLTATEVDINGGTLGGLGTIAGNLVNAATDNPGDPGTQTITGSFTQTSLGDLLLDFAGGASNQYDNLAISGTASLNGILNVELMNSFTPTLDELFTILTFNSGGLSGDFSAFLFPTVNGMTFTTIKNNSNGTYQLMWVTATGPAVPEPGALFLVIPGLAGLLWLRRRNRRG